MKNIILVLLILAVFSMAAYGRGANEKEASSDQPQQQPPQQQPAAAVPGAQTQPGPSGNTPQAAAPTAQPVKKEPPTQALTKAGISPIKEKIALTDFTLPALSGEKLTLSAYKGKVVFLNFWATWCPPCRAEMPSMERLYAKMKDKGFEILAVNLQEEPKVVKEFLTKNKLTFPVVLDANGKIGSVYGVRGIPTTYLIDKEGFIVGGMVGGKEWDTPEVEAALKAIAGNDN